MRSADSSEISIMDFRQGVKIVMINGREGVKLKESCSGMSEKGIGLEYLSVIENGSCGREMNQFLR